MFSDEIISLAMSTRLLSSEFFWRDHQVWLQNAGYMLRPRYRPGWVSSAGNDPDLFDIHEDSLRPIVSDSSKLIDFYFFKTNVV